MKIFHHGDLIQKLSAGERTAPVYVRIKPTNLCNVDCNYCHYKNPYLKLDNYRYTDSIPRGKMLEIIEDFREIGVKAVTFSGGGEPMVYPHLDEAMERILDCGIDLSIISNGTKLEGRTAELLAKAKWVRLSIDSCDAAQYAKIRSVDEELFRRLCKNIENFAKIKNRDCELGINFPVGAENHGQVLEMARLMKSLGANHVKFAPVCNNETEKYHASFMRQVMRDIEAAKGLEDGSFRIIDLYSSDIKRWEMGIGTFDRAYKTCWMKELVCVVAADQRVYYCHDKAYLGNGVVGDLHEKRFKEVWFSDETASKFAKFDAQEICREHCVYDDRNIMLNEFFTISGSHINSFEE